MDMSSAIFLQDPLGQLVAEHRVFRSEATSFRDMAQRYEALIGSIPMAAGPVSTFAEFLGEDVDGRHDVKEELELYPLLVPYLPPGGNAMRVLRGEHEELRGLQRHLSSAAIKLLADPEDGAAQGEVLRVADVVCHLLDLHIEKEETLLLPLVGSILTPKDRDAVHEAFLRFEEEHGRVRARISGGTGPTLPPFCAAGRARREQSERA